MPSLMSFLLLSLMAVPQMHVEDVARMPLFLIQAMIAGVPPQITGPTKLPAILYRTAKIQFIVPIGYCIIIR